jgi:hypothetical protein
MPPAVHRFATTGEAYNASQTHDEIRDGDVLAVEPEGVYGVLVAAWPIAVTEGTGAFHGLAEGVAWDDFEGGRYAEAASTARELADLQAAAVVEAVPLHLVVSFYDSPDVHDRRRSMQLWSNGWLYSSCRDEPGDVWPPPELVGRGHTIESAGQLARSFRIHVREWPAGGEPR